MNTNNKSPRVTLGMPAFKAAFLRQAIDSILIQTFQDFELVIVNDASPDNVDEIVQSYQDSRIRYYVNEINIGKDNFIRNWNRCLDYARGDFFVLASDDDIYEPEFLSKMTELADKYPQVNLFHCRLSVIDKLGKVQSSVLPCLEYERSLDFIHNRAVFRRQQVAPEFMCRTNALKNLGGFVEMPIGWYSDDITWFILAADNGVGYVSECLFRWRVSGLNVSSNNTYAEKKIQAAIEFLHKLIPLVKSLRPISDIEEFQQRDILKIAPKMVYHQMIEDIVPTTFFSFFKLFIRLCRIREFPKVYIPYCLWKKVRFETVSLLYFSHKNNP